jgi:caffeoyl-CoA O-methyltransferase
LTVPGAPDAPPAPRPVTPAGILAAQLERLRDRLEGIDGVGPDVRDEMRRACALAVGLDPYLAACTTPESPALAALAGRTHAEDWDRDGTTVVALEQEMLSGHVEGQFLKFLVRLGRARRVLEIGTFTGYSALAMAEALPDDGELVACELDPYAAAIARECFDRSPSGAKITLRVGPAQTTLEELGAAGERFDLVFVDADKAGYAGYLDTLLDRELIAPGGAVCVDNTLMQGQPWTGATTANGTAIAAFNARVAADRRVEQVLIPLRDGLTLIRRV